MVRKSAERLGKQEQGFTLPEVMATIAILGILIAIAVIIWLGILEQRRVDAATNQLVSDLRLAHSSATNQLTDWRVVVAFERGDEDEGADYYLVRLNGVYESGAAPTATRRIPRYFPGNVGMKKVRTPSGFTVDNHAADYWVAPWNSVSSPTPDTRTIEFNSDGTMRFVPSGPNGSVCVTVDDNPQNRVSVTSATSQPRIEYDSDCDTSDP